MGVKRPPSTATPMAVPEGLAQLPNLGPASAKMLVEAGIETLEQLQELGVAGAYRRLKFHHGRRVSLNFLYAIDAALTGCDWRSLTPDRREELADMARNIAVELANAGRPGRASS